MPAVPLNDALEQWEDAQATTQEIEGVRQMIEESDAYDDMMLMELNAEDDDDSFDPFMGPAGLDDFDDYDDELGLSFDTTERALMMARDIDERVVQIEAEKQKAAWLAGKL